MSTKRVVVSLKDQVALGIALLLSGDLNYETDEYKFGIGLAAEQ